MSTKRSNKQKRNTNQNRTTLSKSRRQKNNTWLVWAKNYKGTVYKPIAMAILNPKTSVASVIAGLGVLGYSIYRNKIYTPKLPNFKTQKKKQKTKNQEEQSVDLDSSYSGLTILANMKIIKQPKEQFVYNTQQQIESKGGSILYDARTYALDHEHFEGIAVDNQNIIHLCPGGGNAFFDEYMLNKCMIHIKNKISEKHKFFCIDGRHNTYITKQNLIKWQNKQKK